MLRAQRCEMSAVGGRVSRSTRTCVPSLREPLTDPCPEPRRRDNVDRFPSRHPCDGRRPRRCREAPPGLPRRPPGPVEPASGRRLRHVRAPRLVAVDHLQRRPHRRHHPGDRRVPHRRRARTGRSSSAPTRMRCPGPLADRVEVLAANDVAVLVDAAGGYTPTPAVSHAILAHNREPRRRHRGRHRDHALPQPAAGRRLQVQPAERRPADTDATKWIAARANGLLAAKLDGVQRRSVGRSAARARTTSSAVTSTTCRRW